MSFKVICKKNCFDPTGDESGAKYPDVPTVHIGMPYTVAETAVGNDGTMFFQLIEIAEWKGHPLYFDADAFELLDVAGITGRVWERVKNRMGI